MFKPLNQFLNCTLNNLINPHICQPLTTPKKLRHIRLQQTAHETALNTNTETNTYAKMILE